MGRKPKVFEFTFHQFSALWVQLGRDLYAEGQGKATVGTAVALSSYGITCPCADFSIMAQILTTVMSESLGIRQALLLIDGYGYSFPAKPLALLHVLACQSLLLLLIFLSPQSLAKSSQCQGMRFYICSVGTSGTSYR
jgi:hypothetical protein